MQVKKQDIRKKIIDSARKEFLNHGYIETSLRLIAEKAGLTKGAVYSYFKNKDALFCELATPAINFIENDFRNDSYYYANKNVLSNTYDVTINDFKQFTYAILDKYESFKLLLFCSAGSSLQNYKEKIIQLYSQNFHKHVSNLKHQKGTISEMFVHTLAATYVSFLEELILHKPQREEVNAYATQLAIYVHSGIENLYRHLNENT